MSVPAVESVTACRRADGGSIEATLEVDRRCGWLEPGLAIQRLYVEARGWWRQMRALLGWVSRAFLKAAINLLGARAGQQSTYLLLRSASETHSDRPRRLEAQWKALSMWLGETKALENLRGW